MSRALCHARALARIASIVAITAALVLLRALLSPVFWLAPERARRVRHHLVRAWARALSATLGLRCRVEGVPPAAPVLLVSNHLSYVDILVFHRVWSGVFVAKSEVASWPALGFLARLAGTLFVDRRRSRALPVVIEAMQKTLRDGESVLFFPEATSSPGSALLPFRAPLFEAAIRSQVPVAAAALHYAVPGDPGAAPQRVCWWGAMTFPDHVYRLLQLPRVDATLRFGRERLWVGEREALAKAARSEVGSLFQATQPGVSSSGGPGLEPAGRIWHLSRDE